MQKSTNKERILGRLLNSPKTTAELARELGYIGPEGVPRYNIIDKDLKALKKSGFIRSQALRLQKPGNSPTSYSIIPDIQNLRNILKEYPDLIAEMQSSELALACILSEHSNLIYISPKEEYVEEIADIKQRVCIDKEDLKEKLQLSAEFFKIFLINDKNKLMHRIRKLVRASGEHVQAEIFVINGNSDNLVIRSETIAGISMAFKACVYMDIMTGQSSIKAEEYTARMGNDIPNEQINQLRMYYKNTETAPEFLRGKKLVPIENPKLQEIEHEFLETGGQFIIFDN